MVDDSVLYRGVEHITYEILSLAGSLLFAVEIDSDAVAGPVEVLVGHAAKNGPVELRALHARNLTELVLSSRPRATDYRADDYFEDFKVNERRALQALHKRACEGVAHLTKKRVTDREHASGTKSKGWSSDDFAPLLRAVILFTERLLPSKWMEPNEDFRAGLELGAEGMRAILRGWGKPLTVPEEQDA